MYLRLIVFVLGLLLSVVNAHAVQVGNLYSSSIPVATQSSADRDSGFREALSHVLVKVSGIDFQYLPTEVFNAPQALIQSYSYVENPDYLAYQERLAQEAQQEAAIEASKNELGDEADLFLALGLNEQAAVLEAEPVPEEPPLPFILEVSFSSQEVDRVLQQSSIAIWGSVRPSIAVWAVYEEAGERRLVGQSVVSMWTDLFREEADYRALPLVLPAGDIEDVALIDMADFWGLYPDAIERVASRYQADVNVMLRLYPQASLVETEQESAELLNTWDGNWLIFLGDKLYSGELLDASEQMLSKQIMSDLSGLLASKYAVLKSQSEFSNVLTVEIENVVSYEDYVGVQTYLKNLPPVVESRLVWVSAGKVGMELTLAGQREQFMEHLALDARLAPNNQLIIEPDQSAALLMPKEFLIWSSSL